MHYPKYFAILIAMLAGGTKANDTVSVSFYQIDHGKTLINSVLDVPKKSIECDVRSTYDENKDGLCAEEWRSYLKKCDEWVFNSRQTGGVAEYLPDNINIVRLSKSGAAGMVISHFEGGSGGGVVDWSIFLIRTNSKSISICPTKPLLSGTEHIPGGNVWYETNCNNESFDTCVERLLYPNRNAMRVIFGESGAGVHKLSEVGRKSAAHSAE